MLAHNFLKRGNSRYTTTGRDERAEKILRELLKTYLQKYGTKRRGVADGYQSLAIAIERRGRLAESVELHRKAHQTNQSMLNENNPTTGLALLSIAAAEIQMGNASAALSPAQDALALYQRAALASALEHLAGCLVGLSRQAGGAGNEALAMIRAARDFLRSAAQYANLCLEASLQ